LQRKDFPVQRDAPWSDDDVAEIKMWREANLQPNRADPKYQGRTLEPPTDEQDKDYWLMRKYRAQALQQEGELLATDDVMRAWVQTKADERDQWLMLASSVQGLLNLSDDQTKQLDEFVRQTLHGFADRMGNLADDARSVPGGSEGYQAAEADEAERVGGEVPLHAPVDDGQPRTLEE
jgi:hypothetical protein